jgi:hypothetical protein
MIGCNRLLLVHDEGDNTLCAEIHANLLIISDIVSYKLSVSTDVFCLLAVNRKADPRQVIVALFNIVKLLRIKYTIQI